MRVWVSADVLAIRQLHASLAESLGRLQLQVEVRRLETFSLEAFTEPAAGAVAQAWIDLRDPEAPRVVVSDGASNRILSRQRLHNAGGDRTLAQEQVAFVVQTAVESAFDLPEEKQEASAAVEPPAAVAVEEAPATEEPANVAPPTPEQAVTLRVPVAARYGVSWLSPDLGATPGATLEGGVFWERTALAPGIFLAGTRYAQATLEEPDAELDATVWSLQLGGTLRVVDIGSLKLEVGVVASLYLWSLDPTLVAPVGSTTESQHRLEPDLTAGLRARVSRELATGVELVLALGLDVDPAPRDYVVDTSFGRRRLVSQATARILVDAGFRFDLVRSQ